MSRGHVQLSPMTHVVDTVCVIGVGSGDGGHCPDSRGEVIRIVKIESETSLENFQFHSFFK